MFSLSLGQAEQKHWLIKLLSADSNDFSVRSVCFVNQDIQALSIINRGCLIYQG